jgi:hypothetical protein
MNNLRIKKLSVRDSKTIEILFTETLDTNLGTDNITIENFGIGDNATIVSIEVSGYILTINTRPLIGSNNYKLTLESTSSHPFKSSRGNYLLEDGNSNVVFFVALSDDNEIRDNILDSLPDIYNKDSGTLLYNLIDTGASELIKTSHAVKEVESANYISIEVTDEEHVRGSGPTDRFNNESVFALLRVGSSQTEAETTGSISFDEFPSYPVSLQQILVSKEEVSNSTNENNGFSGLIITLSKSPIIKITSLVLIRNSVRYTYNIEQYKYGIKNYKYDDNSYSALDLEDNELRLNSSAIGSNFPFPQGNDIIEVSYYYKKIGRDIDSDSLSIYRIVQETRESTPAVSTAFILDHAPIVNSSGDIPTTGGVVWLDPAQNYDSTKKHPAFVTEIVYDTSNLPSSVGEYSVNYETGIVIVFGADGTGTDGTTTVPPVATYKYKKIYQNNIDYVFYSDLDEVASLPSKELRDNPATMEFLYEDTFANGTDFQFSSHIEVLDERVQNRLIENIGIYTLISPVN